MRIIDSDINKRIDIYLKEKFPEFSRSKIKKKIEKNLVLVNGKKVKASYILEKDDKIELIDDFNYEEKITLIPENIFLDIVYEDEYIIIVNKKAGMVVYPAREDMTGTLANGLLYKYGRENLSDVGGEIRLGIIHRLDKETSGLIICAKNNDVHKKLQEGLKSHEVLREYVFICHGNFEKDEFVVKNHIARNPKNRLKMKVFENGKYAETKFKKIKHLTGYTYGSARLITGRTHQIRVHLSNINHPIVGDDVYSDRQDKEKNLYLHSKKIGFIHPVTMKYVEFTREEPDYFKKFIESKR